MKCYQAIIGKGKKYADKLLTGKIYILVSSETFIELRTVTIIFKYYRLFDLSIFIKNISCMEIILLPLNIVNFN